MITLASLLANARVRRITLGLGLCGVAVAAVLVQKWVSYREGRRDGAAAERAASAATLAIAKAEADSAWSVLFARSVATRDSLRTAELSAARASERLATARSLYQGTLAALDAARAVDTSRSPLAMACDEFRTACEERAARSDAVIDSLIRVAELQRLLVARGDSIIRTEPTRTGLAVQRGLDQYRATYRAPSRTKWAAIGAGVGAAAVAAVRR